MASRAEGARTDTWLLSLPLLPTRCKSTSSKPPLQPASHLLQLFLQPGKGRGQSGHLSPVHTSLPAQLAPLCPDPATGPTGSSEGVQPPTSPVPQSRLSFPGRSPRHQPPGHAPQTDGHPSAHPTRGGTEQPQAPGETWRTRGSPRRLGGKA